MNRFVVFIILLSFFGTVMASDRYINIISPQVNATIDPDSPVTVSGTGRGMFEGNVVVRFEDLDGKLLVQKPTTMHRQDIAAAGEWRTSISLPSPVPESIRLIAFSPSPKDGEAAITSAPVMLDTGSDNSTVLEGTRWQASGINNGRGGVVSSATTSLATEQLNESVVMEDQDALELGYRVQAVRAAIQNPETPSALEAITDLGHDQRYYVMVRGWLAWQLQGDMSIVAASKGEAPEKISTRIRFLNQAIRAIDLE